MKTSFAEFTEIAYESAAIRRKVYIDCDRIQAVAPHLDYNLNEMNDRTDLYIEMNRIAIVEGNVKDILETVKAFGTRRKD